MRTFEITKVYIMKKALVVTTILGALFSTQSVVANDVSALNYNKFEIAGGIASSKTKLVSRTFEFKSKAIALGGSYRVSENFYVFGNMERTKTDDKDRKFPIILAINDTSTAIESGLGMILPVSTTTDITFELGARKDRNTTKARVGINELREIKEQKLNDTNLLYAVGVRSYFESGFELTAEYAKSDDFQRLRIGGPMYLSETMAVDLAYEFSRDKTQLHSYKAQGFSLSLQMYF